jgi:hypothetical protein
VLLCEEGLRQWLVSGGGGPETITCDFAGRIYGNEQATAFIPAQAVGPADAGHLRRGKLAMSAALAVSDGHRRGVQGLVRTLAILRHLHQMQGHPLDVIGTKEYQPIELGAGFAGQCREGSVEVWSERSGRSSSH